MVLPTLTSAGYLFPKVDALGNLFSSTCNQLDPSSRASCVPPSRINENYGSVRGMFYEGQSYYNALEMQLEKRMSHGFQVQGAFTWGRSIDTSSASLAGDAFSNSIAESKLLLQTKHKSSPLRFQCFAHAGDQWSLGNRFAEIRGRSRSLLNSGLATGVVFFTASSGKLLQPLALEEIRAEL